MQQNKLINHYFMYFTTFLVSHIDQNEQETMKFYFGKIY